MNPIPWFLLTLPKKYRKYAYAILAVITLYLGFLLVVNPIKQGNIGQVLIVVAIIGIFVISYWYGWKKASK
ncbi:hypothetical protein A2W45_02540 [Candidatus Curtissbacteria bacterium RIFCSPHIGHO2_12_41_11]|uniref:Uncharacterized protein n=2 Tax=Candidatus Curtissiibacteriota TaxID=1752717 RepID=A0A1F5HRA6_9BACT|nr:MAG: hypothetical protein A2Z54_02220 [Candidatus Curtissbacteria bacterium RIFCSPHIGHO2_02_39_8]OGD99964.1 MAG: hypothetical protein A2W45_02540 [Candidatus Curtissbacteria bacterium RIFCSPHIGHO2_12_41_11]OGE06603.1 MAG: hypothetical protein A2W70_04035 [Candidatus Curtissbacteria bacterium RIFCSPLOWO2_02_41_11]